jgi:hypothetical protein
MATNGNSDLSSLVPEAGHAGWLGSQSEGQTLVDVVDIEGGDLHFEWSFSHSRKDHSIAGNMDLESAIQEESPTLGVRRNWI